MNPNLFSLFWIAIASQGMTNSLPFPAYRQFQVMDENDQTKKIRKIFNTPQQVTWSGRQKS
jgi:hypothetical protein